MYMYIFFDIHVNMFGFFFQRYLPASLRMNLFNAYYPVIISGFSIIICFWAEVSDNLLAH